MNLFDIFALLAQGAGYTVLVTVACSITGLVVGLLVTGLRRMAWPWVKPLLDLYAYVFRGVPLLVMLFLVYFGLPGLGIKVSPFLAMILSLGFIAGAYLSEVFRGALDSVGAAEIYAAQAMGFTRFQVLLWIEFPQMLRFSVPGMVNEFTTVLKYSPFAYTVGIPEIMKEAMTLTASTMQGVPIYFALGVLFFLIYRILLIGVRAIERRYQVPGLVLA